MGEIRGCIEILLSKGPEHFAPAEKIHGDGFLCPGEPRRVGYFCGSAVGFCILTGRRKLENESDPIFHFPFFLM